MRSTTRSTIPTRARYRSGWNEVDAGGTDPQIDGAEQLLAAFGGALPPVMWDGLVAEGTSAPLAVHPELGGWTLNLIEQGKGMAGAQPSLLDVGAPGAAPSAEGWGASGELEARIK